MKIRKQDSKYGGRVFIYDKDKYLTFLLGGNGDLYISINSNIESNIHTFTITKENYELYSLFNDLFYDIENINIYDGISSYTKRNITNIIKRNKIYDRENGVITWYSDETSFKVSNILKIIKEADYFVLEFSAQKSIEGYDEDYHTLNYIPIRFRNSGSMYNPLNVIYMKLYNKLREIDDVYEDEHQIHIEEYLYIQKRTI